MCGRFSVVSTSLDTLVHEETGVRFTTETNIDLRPTQTASTLAMIASVGMLFTSSFNLPQAAQLLDQAIDKVMSSGFRTADIASSDSTIVTTDEMRDRIIEALSQ